MIWTQKYDLMRSGTTQLNNTRLQHSILNVICHSIVNTSVKQEKKIYVGTNLLMATLDVSPVFTEDLELLAIFSARFSSARARISCRCAPCCCCLSCNHCSNWTLVVEEISVFAAFYALQGVQLFETMQNPLI